MKAYNTWQVGGEAEYLSEPKDLAELKSALLWAKDLRLPVNLLGDGSNILISDSGIKGLVVCLKNMVGLSSQKEEGDLKLSCWAGSSKAEALKEFLKYKLSPALFLTGLPGNIAGGVVMLSLIHI